MPDCNYLTCRFAEETGLPGFCKRFFRHLRSLYPDGGLGILGYDMDNAGLRKRVTGSLMMFMARFRWAMKLALWLESRFYGDTDVSGLNPENMDQLLLLGIGTHGAEHETILTWWARRQGISVVHMIGNYDHLSSKGYRGAPVTKLLVWGPVMRDDAVYRHGVDPECVEMVGPIRYDSLLKNASYDRNRFIEGCGLDPKKKTILFAGGLAEYHYFEMLRLYEQLEQAGGGYQLILRIYPDKILMSSAYIKPLIDYAQRLDGVYVSIGDPNYRVGNRESEVPHIETQELYNSLRHSDVVINLYSTIALEACLYDRPTIYMLWYPKKSYGWLKPPEYIDYGRLVHNQRMVEYGAIYMAHTAEQLLEAVNDAVSQPDRFKAERARAVAAEIGPLDGKVVERVVSACINAMGPFADNGRKQAGSYESDMRRVESSG